MPDPPKNAEPPVAAPRTPITPGWEKATAAGALSLFFSGAGQLFNRQPRKALLLAIVGHLFGRLVADTRVLLTFRTMVAVLLAALVWKIFVVVDAVRGAKAKKPESPLPVPWLSYTVLAFITILAAWYPAPSAVKDHAGFSAFTIPSRSMCPTICIGDRVVADMHAYRSQSPQRGDIILMKHASSGALFVKRVIGLPGDVVAPGPDNALLVNGQPFHPPSPCSTPTWHKDDPADYSDFHPIKVPEGTLFVVGDNLDDSYDSRIPGFGSVTPDMVRGRPLFLYWSSAFSRIGCTIR